MHGVNSVKFIIHIVFILNKVQYLNKYTVTAKQYKTFIKYIKEYYIFMYIFKYVCLIQRLVVIIYCIKRRKRICAWFQASAAVYVWSSIFCDCTQRRLVSRHPPRLETSVTDYQYTLRKVPEERRSQSDSDFCSVWKQSRQFCLLTCADQWTALEKYCCFFNIGLQVRKYVHSIGFVELSRKLSRFT
jgi:hypothetical protein